MKSPQTRGKIVTEHCNLDSQIITLKMKNLKPLKSRITPPSSANTEATFTLAQILSGVMDRRLSQRVFHAVCPHWSEEDTTILASVRNFSNALYYCRSNFTSFVQEMFPWIQDSDIFEIPRNAPKVIFGMDNIGDSGNCENHLDSLVSLLKDDSPALSDDESGNDTPTRKSVDLNVWAKGPPKFGSEKQELFEVSSNQDQFPHTPNNVRYFRKPRRKKKAKVRASSTEREQSSQLSDSDMSAGTRRSRLKEAKLANKTKTPNSIQSPTWNVQQKLKKVTKEPPPQTSHQFSVQVSNPNTPSTLTEAINQEAIRKQQEEICTLQDNIYMLTSKLYPFNLQCTSSRSKVSRRRIQSAQYKSQYKSNNSLKKTSTSLSLS